MQLEAVYIYIEALLLLIFKVYILLGIFNFESKQCLGKCNLNFLLPLVSMSVCCHKDKDTNLWCTFLSWLLKPSYIFFQQRRESLTSHFCLLRKSYFIRVLVVLYIRPVMSYTSQFTTCTSRSVKNCNFNKLSRYIQGIFLCKFYHCDFHFCDFSKLSKYFANAIFGTQYFNTTIFIIGLQVLRSRLS